MKILPGLAVAKLSGTVGGTTYQNYRGMIVARTKPVPKKTLTARQMFINSLMSLIARAWRDELNQGLRKAWNQRAKNYPWVDVFGREVKMTGENLYIKQNMVLLDHNLARQDTPAPNVIPPEVADWTIASSDDIFELVSPGLPEGTVAEQAPFLDIWVAGGFLTKNLNIQPDHFDFQCETLGLPPGRIAGKSDYRHVEYADEFDTIPVTPVNSNFTIEPIPQEPKNISIILRRYNKYGNFSAPLLLSAVLEAF